MTRPQDNPAAIAKRTRTRLARLDALVAQMHAEYQAGASLSAIGRRYGRDRRSVQELFDHRGLPVRPHTNATKPRRPGGQFLPRVPLTPAQIDELIATATRICVPPALRGEWREWPLARRADFVARLRARIQRPEDRPTTPFSAGLEPFDYGTERAHAIAAALNAGLSSQRARIKINLCSQGVIWRGALWFWVDRVGYVRGPWTQEHGRPCLHHAIWREAHGRDIPRGHVVRFADGNRNNHDPANLVLVTRNDLARENQAAGLRKQSRALTAMLLERAQRTQHDDGHLQQFEQLHKRTRAAGRV